MGYAVVQTVAPYHPEGNPTKPQTTEFVYWIFDKKDAADSHMKDLALAGKTDLSVKKVEAEAWTHVNSKEGKKKAKEEAS